MTPDKMRMLIVERARVVLMASCILGCLLTFAAVAPCQPTGQPKSQDGYYKGKPLAYWVSQASSRQWFKVKEALDVLLKAGPKGKAAMRAVIKALDQKQNTVLAIKTLLAFGEVPRAALPALRRCLKVKQTSVLALHALGVMGEPALYAKRDLIRMTHSRHRDLAFATLERLGIDLIPLLNDELKGKVWRTNALARVVKLGGKGEKTLPILLKILATYPKYTPPRFPVNTQAARAALQRAQEAFKKRRAEAAQQRALAAQAVGRMGTPKRALRHLKRVLKDFDDEASKSALWALLLRGTETVPVLAAIVAKKKVRHQRFVLDALIAFGPAAERALPPLRRKARKASSSMADEAGAAVNAIERSITHIKDVSSSDPKVRKGALVALMNYGAAATPGVMKVLRGEDVALVKIIVAMLANEPTRYLALGGHGELVYPIIPRRRMEPSQFVPIFIDHAVSEDVDLATHAIDALAAIGAPTADHAVGTLVELSKKKTDHARFRISVCNALLAFGQIDGLEDSFFESFVPYLVSEDESTIAAVIRVMGQLGVRATPCVPKLIECFDAGGEKAKTANRALVAIGASAVDRLVEALRADHAGRRAWAAHTIGFYGERAERAIRPLEIAEKDDPDAQVKEMATEALDRIRRSVAARKRR